MFASGWKSTDCSGKITTGYLTPTPTRHVMYHMIFFRQKRKFGITQYVTLRNITYDVTSEYHHTSHHSIP